MEGEFAVKANSSSGVVYEGGIAGRTSVSYSVSIKNYTNKTELNGTIIGGLVGEIQNSGDNKQIILENCLNLAKLTTTSYVGGLVGNMNATQATIRNCANGGELTGTGNYAAGGLVTHTTTTAVTCENSLYLKTDKVTKGLGDQADSAGVITLDTAKVTNGTFSTPIADFLSAIAPAALTVSGNAKLDGTSLTYTEAGEQEIIFSWNGKPLYSKTVTVAAKNMSSETVEIVGVSDSYANDTAAGADLNDVRVIYNGTELVKGTDYTISAADGKFTITFTGNYSGEQTKPYTLNNKFTATSDSLTVTYDGKKHSIKVETTPAEGVNVQYKTSSEGTYSDDVITLTDVGTVTVYWQATKGGMTITGSAVLTITKAAQDISYETKSVSKRIGAANFTNKLTVNEDKTFGEITYESSNESVAKVNAATGEVTIVGVGTAVITATAAGSDNYDEASASYTLTVSRRASATTPDPEPEPDDGLPFTDVPKSAYYYDAVDWAVGKEITDGVSATQFAPYASCTRSQSVTFLYRALGKKVESSTSFTDVPANAFYADAVNWAVANNVTNGTSATTFSPNADCTRAEIVTFLYRAYQGK
jgi:hypothetical protein